MVNDIREIIEKKGDKIVDSFYDIFFDLSPDLEKVFRNTAMQTQKKRLYEGLVEIIDLADQSNKKADYIKDLGVRHVAYEVESYHYPVVRKALIQAFNEHVGELSTEWEDLVDDIVEGMRTGANSLERKVSNGTR